MTAGARDAGGGGGGVLLLNGRGNGHVILNIKIFKRKKRRGDPWQLWTYRSSKKR